MTPHETVQAPSRERVERSLVRVGGGLGFRAGDTLITAAHALDRQPQPVGDPCAVKVQPYGGGPEAWALVACADPVSDLAVLCAVSGRPLRQDARQGHERLVSGLGELPVALDRPPVESFPVWCLTVGGAWVRGVARMGGFHRRRLRVRFATDIGRGTSGAPLVDARGRAVGIVCARDSRYTEACLISAAHLGASLPGWVLGALASPWRRVMDDGKGQDYSAETRRA